MSDIAYRFSNQLDEKSTNTATKKSVIVDIYRKRQQESDPNEWRGHLYRSQIPSLFFFFVYFFVMVFKDYLLCVKITCYVFCLIDITTRKTCKICFWLNKQELNILMSKLWIMENLVLNQQRWNWYTYQIYNSFSDWSSINYIWLDMRVQKPKIKKQPELQIYWLL